MNTDKDVKEAVIAMITEIESINHQKTVLADRLNSIFLNAKSLGVPRKVLMNLIKIRQKPLEGEHEHDLTLELWDFVKKNIG